MLPHVFVLHWCCVRH